MALLTSQNERILICMNRKTTIGIRLASSAASQMGTISWRRGYANSGYTTSPSEKKTGKEREGAGGAS